MVNPNISFFSAAEPPLFNVGEGKLRFLRKRDRTRVICLQIVNIYNANFCYNIIAITQGV